MSTIKKGDTVDLVIRGARVRRVEGVLAGTSRIYFEHAGMSTPAGTHVFDGDDDIEITPVAPPEPEWRRGDLVRLRSSSPPGLTWLRTTQGWAGEFGRSFPPDHLDGCDLVLLVRDGKPVSQG